MKRRYIKPEVENVVTPDLMVDIPVHQSPKVKDVDAKQNNGWGDSEDEDSNEWPQWKNNLWDD